MRYAVDEFAMQESFAVGQCSIHKSSSSQVLQDPTSEYHTHWIRHDAPGLSAVLTRVHGLVGAQRAVGTALHARYSDKTVEEVKPSESLSFASYLVPELDLM